jgi:hypothetical protein
MRRLVMHPPDTEPPDTDPDPDPEEEQTIREINREALAAHEAALAIWADKPTLHALRLADAIPNIDEIIADADKKTAPR